MPHLLQEGGIVRDLPTCLSGFAVGGDDEVHVKGLGGLGTVKSQTVNRPGNGPAPVCGLLDGVRDGDCRDGGAPLGSRFQDLLDQLFAHKRPRPVVDEHNIPLGGCSGQEQIYRLLSFLASPDDLDPVRKARFQDDLAVSQRRLFGADGNCQLIDKGRCQKGFDSPREKGFTSHIDIGLAVPEAHTDGRTGRWNGSVDTP